MFLVRLPATNRSRNHNEQNQNGDKGKRGAVRYSTRMEAMLMRNYFVVGWRLLGSFQVLGYSLIFIEPHALGISADVRFIEDASGKQIELFIFQRLQQTASNLRRGDNFLKRNASQLSLLTQMFAK